jgi:hypothetical protein
MSAQIRPVGILAGEGALPVQLAQYCTKNNIPVCAVQFDNCDYDDFGDILILNTPIEKVGAIFKFLKKNNVADVVMIGNLHRPTLSGLRPDWQGIKTLARIGNALISSGDNALLTALRQDIEAQGLNVRGVDYYLTNLTTPAGCLTIKRCEIDLTMGVLESLRHGQADKGQSILMHDDDTFSFETDAGTTALIQSEGRNGSILIKTMKPRQDPDLDRPTVGLKTVNALIDKKCAGMIIQADAVFMVDKDEMIKQANDHGLFIEAINV